MIEARNVTKIFDGVVAVDSVTTTMKDGSVYGLIGSNGAGKSTFLRMLAGIYRQDSGSVEIDGEQVWENPAVKSRCFFIPDELFLPVNGNLDTVGRYYAMIYPRFDSAKFYKLCEVFALPTDRKLSAFSRGMRKQVMIISAVASGCDYIFCDETFDGLDPMARQAVKSIFAAEMTDRGLTPIIASHNLRELEDMCDHVGLLHKGGIIFSQDIDDMKLGIHKVQCAYSQARSRSDFPESEGFEIVSFSARGALVTMVVRGERDFISNKLNDTAPLFIEMLPLSLEELFLTETEVQGYDIKKLLF